MRPPFCLLLLLGPAFASSGDRSPAFQSCLTLCTSTTCSPLNPVHQSLPLPLRLTRWSCSSNCAYECMHSLESLPDARVQQYYGKWPFTRILGAQEPVSVLASLGNGWMHVRGIWKVRRKMAGWSAVEGDAGIRGWLELYALFGINAWLWSSVFHTRDTPWTERLDYFSAAAAIMYSLYYTLVRLFQLYTLSYADWRSRLASLLTLVYTAHVSYLTWVPKVVPGLPRFDYSYNMIFAICLGLLHNALWLVGSYTSLLPAPRPRRSLKPVAFVILTMAAMSLELFDFPPLWKALDAHALWHVVTIPLVPFWYGWLIEDACDVEEDVRKGRVEKEKR